MASSEETLNQLDKCSSEYTFPMLDNGYVYPAGTRLTAYRDNKRWVIVIEVIGFSYRGGGHDGITNCLHIFGNCLSYEPGTRNENFLYLTGDAYSCNTFDDKEYFYLNPNCYSFFLRENIFPIYHEREVYKTAGIEIEDNTRITAFEFLRLLDALHHDKLIASEEELRERIPTDIPQILELHNWYHPDLANEELPSNNETFIQIAKVLETGNIEYYKPTFKPNTSWKNWTEGGTL